MVQRFIKPDDIYKHHRPKTGQKTEFSSQKHDGRNHESKKIMKKTPSFKLCDVGSDLKGFELSKTIKKSKAIDLNDVSEKDFNPQEPNYLPLEKVPKAEQVDLKHQDIDERKNSEEWMVDYALQKTVTKLAPVKRKKVELLVEAFESVAP